MSVGAGLPAILLRGIVSTKMAAAVQQLFRISDPSEVRRLARRDRQADAFSCARSAAHRAERMPPLFGAPRGQWPEDHGREAAGALGAVNFVGAPTARRIERGSGVGEVEVGGAVLR